MSPSELLNRCDGHWVEILQHFCSQDELSGAIENVQPVDQADRVFGDELPIAIALLMSVKDWTSAEAAKAIEDFLATGEMEKPIFAGPERGASSGLDVVTNIRPIGSRLMAIWDASMPIDHAGAEPLRRFFAESGLSGFERQAPNLRFHPSLRCYERSEQQAVIHVGDLPAMVAPLTNAQDEFVGLYRRYLTDAGAKAQLRHPERFAIAREIEDPTGAAVKLFRAERMLGVTADVLNAAAVRLGAQMSVWVAPSAELRNGIQVPAYVRHVFDWQPIGKAMQAEGGACRESGPEVDDRLVTRLSAEGLDAYVVRPLARRDERRIEWIDVYRERGAAGFPPLAQLMRPLPTAYHLMRAE